MVGAGTSESSTVSNSNGLPDEQPFLCRYIALFVASQPATRKRIAKVLEKQRENQGKRKIRQQNKKKKRKEEQR
jgi:hypothetical protein